MPPVSTSLDRERHAAIALVAQVKEAFGEDEQAICDAIEGQTNFNEAVLAMAEKAKEYEGYAETCANRIGELKTRKERFEHTADKIRHAIGAAMTDLGVKSIPGATLTVSARHGAPGVLISNEELLPQWAWRYVTVRKQETAVIKEAVLGGQTVPGAVKTNGQVITTIRSV